MLLPKAMGVPAPRGPKNQVPLGLPDMGACAETPKARLAVFVSGGGSNFKAIHAAILDGRINAEVVVSRRWTFKCLKIKFFFF